MNNDEEEDSAVVSFPGRLDHVLDVDLDSSIASAPALLQSHSIIHGIQPGSTTFHDDDHYHDDSAAGNKTHTSDRDFQSRPLEDKAVCETTQGEDFCDTHVDTTTMSDASSTPASRYGRKQVKLTNTTSTTSKVLVHARKQLAAMHPRPNRPLLSESNQHPTVANDAEKQNSNDEVRNNEIVREESLNDLLLYKNSSQDTVNSLDTSSSLQSSVISSIICLRKRTIAPDLSADIEEELFKNNGEKEEGTPLLSKPSSSGENAKSCGNDVGQEGEGEEYTLFDFEDNIALDDFLSTLQTSPSSQETSAEKTSTVHWSDEELLFQPDLQEDPSGLTFSFDRMFQCFDPSQDQISISPQTFYSLPCSDFDDDEIPPYGDGGGHGVGGGGFDCFMASCCHDDLGDLNDLAQLDESTIGEDDDIRDMQSKGSLLESYSYNSESLVEGLLKHLELERKSDGDDNIPEDKLDLRNETMATEGDSTLNDSTTMY